MSDLPPAAPPRDPVANPKPSVARMHDYAEHVGEAGVHADDPVYHFKIDRPHSWFFDWLISNPGEIDIETWPRVRPEARYRPFINVGDDSLTPPEKFVLVTGTDEQVRQLYRSHTARAVAERVNEHARSRDTTFTELSDGTTAIDFSVYRLTSQQIHIENMGGRKYDRDVMADRLRSPIHGDASPELLEEIDREWGQERGTVFKSAIVVDETARTVQFMFRYQLLPFPLVDEYEFAAWLRGVIFDLAPNLPYDKIQAYPHYGGLADDGTLLVAPHVQCRDPGPIDTREVCALFSDLHTAYAERFGDHFERPGSLAMPGLTPTPQPHVSPESRETAEAFRDRWEDPPSLTESLPKPPRQ
jgi:hypothetical protein